VGMEARTISAPEDVVANYRRRHGSREDLCCLARM
jgi:hypothetical protein